MKKGFTLIELLAVVVILAVIALIALPLILNIIEDSRRNAAIASANGYVRAVNYKIAQEVLNDRIVADADYVIGENALIVSGKNIENITGSYTINKESVLWAGLCVNGYSVEYNSLTGYSGINDEGNYCGVTSTYVFVEPEAELMSAACTNTSKYDSETHFKIKTVDDLACLSNLVNSGKNFSGKTIYLLADLDISSDSSYSNPSTTAYGDINGNGTTEGLKTELTTGQGFKPIGNSSNKFAGTFDGYAYTIDHLMINRGSQYVGLFGYNAGVVKGVVLKHVSIIATNTGDAYVGGIVGYNDTGKITGVHVSGTVNSSGNYVGGILGYTKGTLDSNEKIESVLFEGTLRGKSYVGGVIGASGSSNSNSTKPIIRGGAFHSTITATNGYAGYFAATANSNHNSVNPRNYDTTLSRTNTATNVVDWDYVTSLTPESVDGALDTVIGGDNDSDGYYFDLINGDFVLFSTSRNPFNTDENLKIKDLKGSGTEDSPYLIRNEYEWRLASTTIRTVNYYSLVTDIDFTDKVFYAFGSSWHRFKGNFNGNMHTISNINIAGVWYTSLFGYNEGTIEGLNVSDIVITARYHYAGGIAGYNTGVIKGVTISSANLTATGTEDEYVGGIVGYNDTGKVTSVAYHGKVTSTGNYVGGIAGYTKGTLDSNEKIDSSLFEGTLRGKSYVGGILGASGSSNTNSAKPLVRGFVDHSSITATNGYAGYFIAAGNNSYNSVNPRHYATSLSRTNTASNVVDWDVITGVTPEAIDGAIDTVIGGDDDSDGYYFDWNSDDKLVIYSTKLSSLVNNLEGSGTAEDPYLIKSYSDWKTASTTINTAKYYSLETDIDFTDKLFYAFGTSSHKFKGYLKGNMHTISNIGVIGVWHTGLFGNNAGTIEGLKISDISVAARYHYAGAIAGYNTGKINGILARSVTVSSTGTEDEYVGGIVGYNDTGEVNNIDFEGTVTSTGGYVGGIVGYTKGTENSGEKIESVLFRGTVRGKTYVGGILGASGSSYNNNLKPVIKGIVNQSSIISTNGYGGILIAAANTSHNSVGTRYYNSTVSRTSTASNVIDWDVMPALTLEGVDGPLDTYIGGDDNSDGYYFDYDNNGRIILYSTAINPITNTLSGLGTATSPYIIANANDWKVASSTINNAKYYSLTADINFSGKKYYALGTTAHHFKGNFNGNMYTVSNITVANVVNAGLFGYNEGVIEGLKLNTITSTATFYYVGSIAGYNTGTIKGIIARSTNVSSTIGTDNMYVGGIVGYNDTGKISSIDYSGTVSSLGNYTGGIVGYTKGTQGSNEKIESVLFKGTVNGKSYSGGILGASGSSYSDSAKPSIKGVVSQSTIKSTNGYGGKVIATASSSHNSITSKNHNTTVSRTNTASNVVDGSDISSLTAANVDGALDTYLNGDNDDDGYYYGVCTGNLTLLSKTLNPLNGDACPQTAQ